MSLIIAGLYSGHLSLSLAAPVTNRTTLNDVIAPPWVADPSGRGTWGILSSCVFTLVLCVYTAIHLNLPAKNDTQYTIWLRKIKWVLIAIFGPEVVVLTAFDQLLSARQFLRDLRDPHYNIDKDLLERLDADDAPLDLIYGYYVGMGGFAADVQHLHDEFERVTVTEAGVLYLARHGYLCKVRKSGIEDKSKADSFSKGLVCIQVVWVIGQVIERKAAGYPITLLEIHTIVHAVCALLMYGLWFKKPLEIHAPTVLNFDDHLDLLALMLQVPTGLREDVIERSSSWEPPWLSNNRVRRRPVPGMVWHGTSDPFEKINHANDKLLELSCLNSANSVSTKTLCCFAPVSEDSEGTNSEGAKRQFLMGKATLDPFYYRPCKGKLACVLFSGQTLINGLGPPIPRSWYTEQTVQNNVETPVFTVQLSEKDIKRLGLVEKFLERINFRKGRLGPQTTDLGDYVGTDLSDFNSDLTCYGITFRTANFKQIIIVPTQTNPWRCAGLATIPMAYGSVHLTAWSMSFPTTTERSLWCASCFYLLGSAVALTMIISWAQFQYATSWVASTMLWRIKSAKDENTNFDLGPIPKTPVKFGAYLIARQAIKKTQKPKELETGVKGCALSDVLFGGIQARLRLLLGKHFELSQRICKRVSLGIKGCIGIVYLGARIYIVAESFLSLRHVPIGVYQTPDLNVMGMIPHI